LLWNGNSSYYYSSSPLSSPFFPRTMNLSTADLRNYWTEFHETWRSYRYLPTYQILMISENVEFLPPIFYAVFWQPLWKWQTFETFQNVELLL
jgi:hypothetical protein